MNTALTVAKFVLYSFTGSLVILAEAWHSFSDIATSVCVYWAMSKRIKEESKPGLTPDTLDQVEGSTGSGREKWNLEMSVSLGIGVFLLIVSLMLIRSVIWGERVIVAKPVLAGLIFIGFALGSYLISRFEGSVGARFHSVGLISDSLHAKADMTASLLAGFSLILYGLGLDLDRFAALIISLFILSFALEVLVNVIWARLRGDGQILFQIKSYQIMAFLFNPRQLKALFIEVESRYGWGLLRRSWLHKSLRYLYRSIPIIVILIYVSTMLYTVRAQEQALVLRFGRAIQRQPVGPGLHLKLPWPIDRTIIVDVTSINSKSVGNITDAQSAALLWTRAHGTEEAFLSGDNYFMFPYVIVHYRIKDLYAYIFQFDDPVQILEDITNQAISKLFARRSFYEIVTSYRADLADDLIVYVQSELDQMQVGLDVVSVHFKDIHPPISIADSFEQVIAALQEKERTINEAYGYRNKNVPESRGQALRTVEQAQAYVVEKVDRAEGDARRFLLQNEIYQTHLSVLKRKLHLETMKNALSATGKVVYDPKAGKPSIWMGKAGSDAVTWQGGNE